MSDGGVLGIFAHFANFFKFKHFSPINHNLVPHTETAVIASDGLHSVPGYADIRTTPLDITQLSSCITTATFKQTISGNEMLKKYAIKPKQLDITLHDYRSILNKLEKTLYKNIQILSMKKHLKDPKNLKNPKNLQNPENDSKTTNSRSSLKSATSILLKISFVAKKQSISEESVPIFIKRSEVRQKMEKLFTTLSIGNPASWKLENFETADFCKSETCENFKVCSDLADWKPDEFVNGHDLILRQITSKQRLTCECPKGFGGEKCDIQMDDCFSAPCQNDGRCVSLEGGYVCQCRDKTRGKNCEIDIVNTKCSSDSCSPSAPGCANLLIGGFSCQCPRNFDNLMAIPGDSSFCEQRSVHLDGPKSWISVKQIDTKWGFLIQMSFVTWKPDAIILSSGRLVTRKQPQSSSSSSSSPFSLSSDSAPNHTLNLSDHLVIGLARGRVFARLSTGTVKSDQIELKLATKTGINDGKWHKITLEFQNLPDSKFLSKASAPPSKTKQLKLFLDDCDPRFNRVQKGHSSCFVQKNWTSPGKSFDVDSSVTLGQSDFTGCIGNLKLNHKNIDFADDLAQQNTRPGCLPLASNYCGFEQKTLGCKNSGTCENRYGRAVCKCGIGFTGEKCEIIGKKENADFEEILSLENQEILKICEKGLNPCVGKDFTKTEIEFTKCEPKTTENPSINHGSRVSKSKSNSKSDSKSNSTPKSGIYVNQLMKCSCPPSRYGEFCEFKRPGVCPSGWRGHPICRPCNCPVERNFDATCDEIDGSCRCKPGYYLSANANSTELLTCLPCQCHLKGANSNICNKTTGQCDCVTSVFGRRCEKCQSDLAEVTSQGCRIVYNECPSQNTIFKTGAISDSPIYIEWPRTKNSNTAVTNCPGTNSRGKSTRECSSSSTWESINLDSCTSDSYFEMQKMVSRKLTTSGCVELVEEIRQASPFFDHDLEITVDGLIRILKFQTGQTGYNLSMTRDIHFNTDLIQQIEFLLNSPKAKNLRPGSLMALIDAFAGYITRITLELGQLYEINNQVQAQSEQIILLSRSLTHSEYRTENVKVEIPEILSEKDNLSFGLITISDQQIGSTKQIKNSLPISSLLPLKISKKYHWTVPPRPVLNSASVSIVVSKNLIQKIGSNIQNQGSNQGSNNAKHGSKPSNSKSELYQHLPMVGPGQTPNRNVIKVTFKLYQSEQRSRPHCVLWHSDGWLKSPYCSVTFYNNSHVTCSCQESIPNGKVLMVLMDTGEVSVLESTSSQIVVYTLLLVTFLILSASILARSLLHEVRSNTAFLNKNFTIAILLSLFSLVLAINSSESKINPLTCTSIAIFIYYIFLAAMTWHCLASFHVYRRVTDARVQTDTTPGLRRFYFLLGWGLPIICTSISVGLKSDIFGNASFCWLSWNESSVWAIQSPHFIIPLFDAVLISFAWLETQRAPTERASINPVLGGSSLGVGLQSPLRVPLKQIRDSKIPLKRASFTWIFPYVIWQFSWISANWNNIFGYLLVCVVSLVFSLLDLYFVIKDNEIQRAWRLERTRKERKKKLSSKTAALLSHAVAYSNNSTTENGSCGRNSRLHELDTSGTQTNSPNRREKEGVAVVTDNSETYSKKSGNRVSKPNFDEKIEGFSKNSLQRFSAGHGTASSMTSDTASSMNGRDYDPYYSND